MDVKYKIGSASSLAYRRWRRCLLRNAGQWRCKPERYAGRGDVRALFEGGEQLTSCASRYRAAAVGGVSRLSATSHFWQATRRWRHLLSVVWVIRAEYLPLASGAADEGGGSGWRTAPPAPAPSRRRLARISSAALGLRVSSGANLPSNARIANACAAGKALFSRRHRTSRIICFYPGGHSGGGTETGIPPLA